MKLYPDVGRESLRAAQGILKFDADGPQRYSSIRTTSLQVHSGASLAYDFGSVAVGVTVQNVSRNPCGASP